MEGADWLVCWFVCILSGSNNGPNALLVPGGETLHNLFFVSLSLPQVTMGKGARICNYILFVYILLSLRLCLPCYLH